MGLQASTQLTVDPQSWIRPGQLHSAAAKVSKPNIQEGVHAPTTIKVEGQEATMPPFSLLGRLAAVACLAALASGIPPFSRSGYNIARLEERTVSRLSKRLTDEQRCASRPRTARGAPDRSQSRVWGGE